MSSSSINVDGIEYTLQIEGINIVTIEPVGNNQTGITSKNVDADKPVNKTLHQALSDNLKEPGTVVVIVTQAVCIDSYAGWYRQLEQFPGLIVTSVEWDDEDRDVSAVIMMACYKQCPETTMGTLPKTIVDDEMGHVVLQTVVNFTNFNYSKKISFI